MLRFLLLSMVSCSQPTSLLFIRTTIESINLLFEPSGAISVAIGNLLDLDRLRALSEYPTIDVLLGRFSGVLAEFQREPQRMDDFITRILNQSEQQLRADFGNFPIDSEGDHVFNFLKAVLDASVQNLTRMHLSSEQVLRFAFAQGLQAVNRSIAAEPDDSGGGGAGPAATDAETQADLASDSTEEKEKATQKVDIAFYVAIGLIAVLMLSLGAAGLFWKLAHRS